MGKVTLGSSNSTPTPKPEVVQEPTVIIEKVPVEVVKQVIVEVEKVVEVPVEIIKEVPVIQVQERIIKVPFEVEKIVEKIVEVKIPYEVVKEKIIVDTAKMFELKKQNADLERTINKLKVSLICCILLATAVGVVCVG